jgi:2-aminoadipate transaminase
MERLLSERARNSTSSAIRDLLRLTAQPHILSMAGGLPAAELFPVAGLRAIADEILGDPRAAEAALQYGPTEGTDELRGLVGEGAGELRGLVGEGAGEPMLITTGSQQGLDLLARTLLDAGDVVVVESPTYLGALQALRGQAPNIVPIDADEDGLDTARLAELLAAGLRPKLCYVVPNFSNPSGATLRLERRRHLATLADRYGFMVIEDDPYGALRFRGSFMDPVGAFGANVVTLGSASKTLAPGLRVGWLRAPKWLLAPLVRQKQAADLQTSSFAQAVVARALQAPWYPAHLASLRVAYRERADAMCAALARHQDVLSPTRAPHGGMFAWVRLHDGVDATALLPGALAAGVAYVPGAAFSLGSDHASMVRLSFAGLERARLDVAIDRLASVVAGRTRHAAFA